MTQNEDIDENNDIDLSNDVFSKFDSLPGMDSDSDNEPIVKSNNINKLQKETPSKIIVKVFHTTLLLNLFCFYI